MSKITGNIVCQCQRGFLGLRCEQDICYQHVLVGPCFQSTTRYYYDPISKECKTFTFSGCNGNLFSRYFTVI